mmetsp:Transcript_132039/g.263497  ORF Transcript_132039/g.263497 Transcript_132039/m.263497 type:complete len:372 (-) Transcript_132039:126-1241(-)
MASSMGSHVASAWGYSGIHDDSETSTQEFRLGCNGRPAGISVRTLLTTSLLLGAATSSFILATSFGSSYAVSSTETDGEKGLMMVGLAELANGTDGPGLDGGDIRIKVCRNKDCDKIHPHGLVHEYTANLNTCEKLREDTNTTSIGEYRIIGATAATLAEGNILTAQQCGNETSIVGTFSLIVGSFTDCCSFRPGDCGYKCLTFKQAYIPPAPSAGRRPGAFLLLPAIPENGQSWAAELRGVKPILTNQSLVAGRWGECMHWAVVFEFRHDWWRMPAYASTGPAGQVIDFLFECGFESAVDAMDKNEAMTFASLYRAQENFVFEQVATEDDDNASDDDVDDPHVLRQLARTTRRRIHLGHRSRATTDGSVA